jgi:hypothetical protein
VVGERPNDRAGMRPIVAAFGKGRQLFVGHELIDRARLPEVAVREVRDRDIACAFLVECRMFPLSLLSPASFCSRRRSR